MPFFPLSKSIKAFILGFIATALLFTAYLLSAKPLSYEPSTIFSGAISSSYAATIADKAWWTSEVRKPRFAYVQYVTEFDYLCNSLINAARLLRFEVDADIVILIPLGWSKKKKSSSEGRLIAYARAKYPTVIFTEVKIMSTGKGDKTWMDSLTKFRAFEQTEYTRVLAFDSDVLVMNNMDHLFLAPKAALAVPRAYWLNKDAQNLGSQVLASHIMLLEPSERMFQLLLDTAEATGDFDMEVVNSVFNSSAMILPHRGLAMLTGEFRAQDHSAYLVSGTGLAEEWNGYAELSRAFIVHFSDWPSPKPWRPRTKQQWDAALPPCEAGDVERDDRPACADRVAWESVYEEYSSEKKAVCEVM
ncbi:hypothetical protein M1834_008259 [Neofusicoccum parvum]|nr:hypothetical protein M1834_008259 [Neofusicoccum parvum]